jgi:hypothetical protein
MLPMGDRRFQGCNPSRLVGRVPVSRARGCAQVVVLL